ncbi:MAG: FAD-dependent oxidoreductase [Atribacterota bacterium]
MRYPNLFASGRIGKCILRNRVVMPPMATNLGSAFGEVTPELLRYYERRARGGVGLIIVENAQVDMFQGRSLVAQIAVDSDKFLPGLRALAEVIHAGGAGAFLQIQHGGRQCTPSTTDGLQPVAPSPVPCKFLQVTPRALTREEIRELVEKFAQAALRAKVAGFDGVEVHAAHGYLLNEFLSPYTNRRDDEYGGSFENRMRFLLEILGRIRELVGEDFVVGVRLSVEEFVPGGLTLAESREIARELEAHGVDYISVSCGIYESVSTIIEPMNFPEGWRANLARGIKEVVSCPVIAVGVIRHPEVAERILAAGDADFVAIGRGLIADPDWVRKVAEGREEEINHCISCNVGCIGELFANGKVHCAVNPWAGRELYFDERTRAPEKKRVVVVGGGPGGMMAALVAAQRGHEVHLFEKEKELGGQLRFAALAPHKDKLLWFVEYLRVSLEKFGVSVYLESEATPEAVLALHPQAVIVATGGVPVVPEFSALDPSFACTAWDVLQGKVRLEGKEVVVIGGGVVGCETALFLAERENRVTIVEMLPQLAADAEVITRIELLKALNVANIRIMTSTRCIDVQGRNVVYLCDADPKTSELHPEYIVFALGTQPNRELFDILSQKMQNLFLVGDAREPRKVYHAVYEGALAAAQV